MRSEGGADRKVQLRPCGEMDATSVTEQHPVLAVVLTMDRQALAHLARDLGHVIRSHVTIIYHYVRLQKTEHLVFGRNTQ